MSGIGWMTYDQEKAERKRIITEYAEKAKRGAVGTHGGKKGKKK